MAYKPILFNTEMVEAILAGRKTQTRRIVKKKYSNTDLVMFTNKHGTRLVERQNDAPPPREYTDENGVRHTVVHLVAHRELVPPCSPGDVLWVRETWAHPSETEIRNGADADMFIYKADSPLLPAAYDRWHPSIHMPKAAARIFLRVKDVRSRRLHHMDSLDGLAEGILPDYIGTTIRVIDKFVELWDSTIKPADLDKYGWDANPWVWVIEFEPCEKPEVW